MDRDLLLRFRHSGKIRVLAWLHVFQNWPIKDLFSFIERFGMPFVVAKVDPRTWEEERYVLNNLIRSFGPNGGGVFSRNTELQLLNAANTGGDNVYFRALDFTHNAIYTMLVGQLASSGDSAGMSNGDAQSAVRQDILEADARAVEATVRAQIAAPWTAFQFGTDVAVPRIHFQVEPAEDLSALANTVATLYNGGLEADPAEMSEKFGIKLSRRVIPPAAPGGGFPMSAEPKNAQTNTHGLHDALEEWLGPIANDINDAVNLSDDDLDQRHRSGNIAESGDSTKLAAIMEQEMRKEYNRGNKIQHRS